MESFKEKTDKYIALIPCEEFCVENWPERVKISMMFSHGRFLTIRLGEDGTDTYNFFMQGQILSYGEFNDEFVDKFKSYLLS